MSTPGRWSSADAHRVRQVAAVVVAGDHHGHRWVGSRSGRGGGAHRQAPCDPVRRRARPVAAGTPTQVSPAGQVGSAARRPCRAWRPAPTSTALADAGVHAEVGRLADPDPAAEADPGAEGGEVVDHVVVGQRDVGIATTCRPTCTSAVSDDVRRAGCCPRRPAVAGDGDGRVHDGRRSGPAPTPSARSRSTIGPARRARAGADQDLGVGVRRRRRRVRRRTGRPASSAPQRVRVVVEHATTRWSSGASARRPRAPRAPGRSPRPGQRRLIVAAPASTSTSTTRACSESDIWWKSGRISVRVGQPLGDRQRPRAACAGVRRLAVDAMMPRRAEMSGLGELLRAAPRGRAGSPAAPRPRRTGSCWCPTPGRPRCAARDLGDRLGVAGGELAAARDDLGQPAELDEADRGLQVGHPEVVADLDVLLRRGQHAARAGRRRRRSSRARAAGGRARPSPRRRS